MGRCGFPTAKKNWRRQYGSSADLAHYGVVKPKKMKAVCRVPAIYAECATVKVDCSMECTVPSASCVFIFVTTRRRWRLLAIAGGAHPGWLQPIEEQGEVSFFRWVVRGWCGVRGQDGVSANFTTSAQIRPSRVYQYATALRLHAAAPETAWHRGQAVPSKRPFTDIWLDRRRRAISEFPRKFSPLLAFPKTMRIISKRSLLDASVRTLRGSHGRLHFVRRGHLLRPGNHSLRQP